MIKRLDLGDDGFLIVEIEEGDFASLDAQLESGRRSVSGLPGGSRLTSAEEDVNSAKNLLFNQIKSASKLVKTAMSESSPDEFTLELHVKFGGESTIIPFLTKASGEGGLKITAKWNK